MGLFDKVLGTSNDKVNESEGFTGVVLCAIAADGVLEQEELQGMFTTLARMKLFQGMSDRQFRGGVDKVVRMLKEKGFDATVDACAAAVPANLKQTAFAVSADLLMADGHVAAQEKKFLERIQKSLGVSDDLAVKIVEVISIKNQG